MSGRPRLPSSERREMDTNFSSTSASATPQELIGQLPREVHLTQIGIWGAILWAGLSVVFFAVMLPDVIDAVQETPHTAELRRDGSETVGEITRLWHPGRHGFRISYTFTANQSSFSGKADVPQKLRNSLREFGSLPIRYLPANPAINHPAAWEDLRPRIWVLIYPWLLCLPILIVATQAIAFAINLRNERRLLAEGALAAGVITRCRYRSRGGIRVKYEFQTQDGRMSTGSGSAASRCKVGSQVWVIYLPQDAQRNLPYPSLYYRVVQRSIGG